MASVSSYVVRELTADDVDEIYQLCIGNTLYYQYAPPLVSKQSILEDLRALPPGKSLTDKYFLGYYQGTKLVAVLDLVYDYPAKGVAFIGFFMTDPSVQKRGVGSDIIEELCTYLKLENFTTVRLAWVEGNPQSTHFWQKNGFKATGERSKQPRYTVVLAERSLKPGD